MKITVTYNELVEISTDDVKMPMSKNPDIFNIFKCRICLYV